MRILLAIVFMMASLFLSSCGGEPKMDGRSAAAFKTSIKTVGESLPIADRQKFAGSIIILGLGTSLDDSFKGKDATQFETLRKKLDGKTGHEVIAFVKQEIERKNKSF